LSRCLRVKVNWPQLDCQRSVVPSLLPFPLSVTKLGLRRLTWEKKTSLCKLILASMETQNLLLTKIVLNTYNASLRMLSAWFNNRKENRLITTMTLFRWNFSLRRPRWKKTQLGMKLWTRVPLMRGLSNNWKNKCTRSTYTKSKLRS
jgi:hypothetical protein